MYTRCPSCRAEISFEPPANMESLPDGYKHRIKCPSCGVTIGVKINKIDTQATTIAQPTYNQPEFEPINYDTTSTNTVATKKKASGLGRNITMIILSLLFIALTVVGYLVNAEIIDMDLFGIDYLDGVSGWIDVFQGAENLKIEFELDTLSGILCIVPMALLALSAINLIVALVSAIGKKYGRAYNVISSILIGGCAIVAFFSEMLRWEFDFMEYMKWTLEAQEYMLYAGLALGIIQVILGLCFIAPLKEKEE